MFALIGQLHDVFSLDFFFTAEGAGCGGGELMWIISLDLFNFKRGGGQLFFILNFKIVFASVFLLFWLV